MSARYLSVVVVLALGSLVTAGSAQAGDRSDDVRKIGARHHSPDASRPAPTAVRSSGGSAPSGLTQAQSRHPRAGTGHGPRGSYYGRPGGYYRPYYYRPYYTYYGYGAFPYFDFYYGYGYGGPYYRGGYWGNRYYGNYGSVRVLVDPSETRVYVDGYYAGTADDFDGLFQRLHVAPGRHDLTFKLEGFRSHRMRVYVPWDRTLKLHYDMVKGSGEASFEDLAGGRDEDTWRDDADWRARPDAGRWRDERRERVDPPRREGSFERRSTDEERNGTLRLDVRPEGASIYVDGEFRGTARTLQRLQLPAGPHRVEILHPGLRTFERDVTLQSGEGFDLEVELTK